MTKNIKMKNFLNLHFNLLYNIFILNTVYIKLYKYKITKISK